ncbi:hypothetical protein niasHT_028839 [Heterodera trifolii]|uniref:BTB domain-containing protein n=1 Tax=Heterodera trifolii TaxID=157864 RepID=A0ABD2KQE3_9BILA
MAPPAEKKKKHSSADHRQISSTAIGEHEQQSPMGSLMTSLGKRRSVRVTNKMNKRILKKIWICTDVWMDILPFFDRPQLGLKLALLSPRFDVLVDKHFDGKSELTILRPIEIRKGGGLKPKLSVFINYDKSMRLPLPDRPLPNKIRFNRLIISYFDYSVVKFLRSNKQIFAGRDINLCLKMWSYKSFVQPIWDVLARKIWPFFASNIRQLSFSCADHLDNLCHFISPTILFDLNINLINSNLFLPDVPGDFDGPNSTPTAGQTLSKWLHFPRKDGQPKRLICQYLDGHSNSDWFNNFKEAFLRATSSACYIIQLVVSLSTPIVPFELVNEQTKEKLTLDRKSDYKWEYNWVMKRSKIGQMVQWEEENLDKLSTTVSIFFNCSNKCFGHLSPQAAAKSKRKGELCGSSDENGNKLKTEKPDILADRMKLLQSTAKFADVHFLLMRAHRAILSASSDVFEAIFQKEATQNANGKITSAENDSPAAVLIPDFDAEAFNVMLRLIYSDDLRELGKNAAEVLYAALKFNVIGLVKAFADFPIHKLSNVFAALSIAFLKSEGFLKIDQRLLCEILERANCKSVEKPQFGMQ